MISDLDDTRPIAVSRETIPLIIPPATMAYRPGVTQDASVFRPRVMMLGFFSGTSSVAGSASTAPPVATPDIARNSSYTSGTVVPMTHWIWPLDSTTFRMPLTLLNFSISTASRLTGTMRSRVMQ